MFTYYQAEDDEGTSTMASFQTETHLYRFCHGNGGDMTWVIGFMWKGSILFKLVYSTLFLFLSRFFPAMLRTAARSFGLATRALPKRYIFTAIATAMRT